MVRLITISYAAILPILHFSKFPTQITEDWRVFIGFYFLAYLWSASVSGPLLPPNLSMFQSKT